MRTAIRYITIVILLAWPVTQFQALSAGPGQLIPLAKSQMSKGDYYGAITECMRYRYCYPGGAEYPLSMLIQGEAYYRGGNYAEATRITAECFERYKQRREATGAYKSWAHAANDGSPFFAFAHIRNTCTIGGQFRGGYARHVPRDRRGDAGARARLDGYARTYPDGGILKMYASCNILLTAKSTGQPRGFNTRFAVHSRIRPFLYGQVYDGHIYAGKQRGASFLNIRRVS